LDRVNVLDVERVSMGLPASFVWDYDARRPRLGRLYEKSKVSQWNAATDVDWSIEVDPGFEPEIEQFANVDWEGGPISTALGVRDDPAMMHEIVAQNHGWLISQFMHGEQGALVATAKICAAAESIDDKYYAAAQVADEARHVEAYQRYLDKVGVAYPVSTPLHDLLDQVMGHKRRYDTSGMRSILEAQGFTVEKVYSLNKAGSPPWWAYSKIFGRKHINKAVLKIFDKTVWFWRHLDALLPWPGLSLILVATKNESRSGARGSRNARQDASVPVQ